MLRLKIQRALPSVSGKSEAVPLAQAPLTEGSELISTGGAGTAWREAGFPVKDTSERAGVLEPGLTFFGQNRILNFLVCPES